MKKFAAGERPVIFGDGEQTRDFVYVRDIAVANRLALENNDIACDVFNVGSGRSLSLNQLTAMLGSLHGKRLKPVYKAGRPGEVRHSVAHTGKISQKLGFQPRFKTENALRQMLEFA
jgi:UDP-glucose 4-epimerase